MWRWEYSLLHQSEPPSWRRNAGKSWDSAFPRGIHPPACACSVCSLIPLDLVQLKDDVKDVTGVKHLMDVGMWGMLIRSSPRGIGVWEGKNLLSMVLFSALCCLGGGSFPLEHPHP